MNKSKLRRRCFELDKRYDKKDGMKQPNADTITVQIIVKAADENWNENVEEVDRKSGIKEQKLGIGFRIQESVRKIKSLESNMSKIDNDNSVS